MRYRVNISLHAVRELLSEFKRQRGIPDTFPLSNGERDDFEQFAILEGRRRGVDVFGDEDYRKQLYKNMGKPSKQ